MKKSKKKKKKKIKKKKKKREEYQEIDKANVTNENRNLISTVNNYHEQMLD